MTPPEQPNRKQSLGVGILFAAISLAAMQTRAEVPAGTVLPMLPTGSETVSGHEALHYHGGLFYQQEQGGVRVVVAPLATRVEQLPGHTVPFSHENERYYFAGGSCFVYENGAYVAVKPPPGAAVLVFEAWRRLPQTPKIVAYDPAKDPELQRYDRFRCHQWATAESGYSIAVSPFADPGAYTRAMNACLLRRGYTIQ